MKKYVELVMRVMNLTEQDVVTMSQTNNSSLNDHDDIVGDFFN